MVRRFPPSSISPNHPDYPLLSKIRDGIYSKAGGAERLTLHLPLLLKDAVDFVLDPVRTGRTKIAELDKVEKTYIGLKVEHYLREWLGVPKGLKRDIQIDGLDVDIKNTISTTWMIPPETYRTE
ncbi:MAG: NaeI family type II restriction endonuclease, partial [Hyphomicrobium sp.]